MHSIACRHAESPQCLTSYFHFHCSTFHLVFPLPSLVISCQLQAHLMAHMNRKIIYKSPKFNVIETNTSSGIKNRPMLEPGPNSSVKLFFVHISKPGRSKRRRLELKVVDISQKEQSLSPDPSPQFQPITSTSSTSFQAALSKKKCVRKDQCVYVRYFKLSYPPCSSTC